VRQFSDQHIAALVVMVLIAAVSVWAARRHPGRWIRAYAVVLALAILATWVRRERDRHLDDTVTGLARDLAGSTSEGSVIEREDDPRGRSRST
jgi:hypothetical protein